MLRPVHYLLRPHCEVCTTLLSSARLAAIGLSMINLPVNSPANLIGILFGKAVQQKRSLSDFSRQTRGGISFTANDDPHALPNCCHVVIRSDKVIHAFTFMTSLGCQYWIPVGNSTREWINVIRIPVSGA